MTFDVSITANKAKGDPWWPKFAEGDAGFAGIAGTRKEPVVFTERQLRLLGEFYSHIHGIHQRTRFYGMVQAQLSGCAADGAVRSVAVAAAVELGLPIEQLRKLGLAANQGRRGAYAIPGNSKDADGVEF